MDKEKIDYIKSLINEINEGFQQPRKSVMSFDDDDEQGDEDREENVFGTNPGDKSKISSKLLAHLNNPQTNGGNRLKSLYHQAKNNKQAGINALKRIGGVDANVEGDDLKSKNNAIANIDKFWVNHPLNGYNKSDEEDYMVPDKYGRVKVSYYVNPDPVNYDEPISVFKFKNIDPQDCSLLTQHLANIPDILNISMDQKREATQNHPERKNDGIAIMLFPKDAEKFMKSTVPYIVSILKNIKNENGEPKYFKDENEINNFYSYLKQEYYTNTDTVEIFRQISMDNVELFKRFLTAQNDEDIQAYINVYGRSGLIQQICDEGGLDIRFGKTLSVQNGALVLGSKTPTGAGVMPTFILTKKIWYTRFKRIVKPNAVPYRIWCPVGQKKIRTKHLPTLVQSYLKKFKNGTEITLQDAVDVLKNEFHVEDFSQLSFQQKTALNIVCNQIVTKFFFPCVEFDISDTELIDPNGEDIFEKEVGLSNRFTGERNKAAMDLLDIEEKLRHDQEKAKGAEISDSNVDANEESELKSKLFKWNKTAFDLLMISWKKNGVSYPFKKSANPSENLVNAIKAEAREKFHERTITKSEQLDKLSNWVAKAVLFSLGLGLDVYNEFDASGEPNEMFKLVGNVATSILNNICEAAYYDPNKGEEAPLKMVAESTGNLENDFVSNLDKNEVFNKLNMFLRKTFGIEKNINEEKDKFFLMLERMDKSKTNLLY